MSIYEFDEEKYKQTLLEEGETRGMSHLFQEIEECFSMDISALEFFQKIQEKYELLTKA